MDLILSAEEVCQVLKISKVTFIKIRKNGFPKGFTITPEPNSKKYWLVDDIKSWLASKAKEAQSLPDDTI